MFVFPLQYVQNFINQTWSERYQSAISEHVLTLIWSIIVSSFTIGGLIGASIGGTLSLKLGRCGSGNIPVETNQFPSFMEVSHCNFCFQERDSADQ